MSSRLISDLEPELQKKATSLLRMAKEKLGVDLTITSTYRSIGEQNELYERGRSKSGVIVTKARGGESWHNYRLAFDVVPIVNGKPVWNDDKLWERIGKLGESLGLQWGGRWNSFKDKPHFYEAGLTPKPSKGYKPSMIA